MGDGLEKGFVACLRLPLSPLPDVFLGHFKGDSGLCWVVDGDKNFR